MGTAGKLLIVLAAAALVAPLAIASHPTPPAPPQAGPDLPAALPVAVVTVFENVVYSGWAGVTSRVVDVPAAWNRVFVTLESRPMGDPWDRTFGVAVGGVEVLHGTTPRTSFSVRKEITEFAVLLPPSGTALVQFLGDSWVGALSYTLRLEFYDDPLGLVLPRAEHALGAFLWGGMWGAGSRMTRAMAFPADAPTLATVEITMSGHGTEEFWYLNGLVPRTFHVLVDGVEVAKVHPLPYVYALLGFTGSFGETVHPVMWWTAQRGLDVAGVHTGAGEIPPYRATVHPEHLGLLAGARTVEIRQEGGYGVWITSVSFLIDQTNQ